MLDPKYAANTAGHSFVGVGSWISPTTIGRILTVGYSKITNRFRIAITDTTKGNISELFSFDEKELDEFIVAALYVRQLISEQAKTKG